MTYQAQSDANIGIRISASFGAAPEAIFSSYMNTMLERLEQKIGIEKCDTLGQKIDEFIFSTACGYEYRKPKRLLQAITDFRDNTKPTIERNNPLTERDMYNLYIACIKVCTESGEQHSLKKAKKNYFLGDYGVPLEVSEKMLNAIAFYFLMKDFALPKML